MREWNQNGTRQGEGGEVMARITGLARSLTCAIVAGRGENHGEGPRTDEAAYHEVLPDENTITGRFAEIADAEVQPSHGGRNEGRNERNDQ